MKTQQEKLWQGKPGDVIDINVKLGDAVVQAQAKNWIVTFPMDGDGGICLTIGGDDPEKLAVMFRQVCWKMAMSGYDPLLLFGLLSAAIEQVVVDTSDQEWT